MKAAVIVFPGSNCDRDVAVALRQACGVAPLMVWHRETDLPDLDLIVVPGGFAYGDYLRAGAMAAHSPVMRTVARRAAAGVRVLGICNGFQVLVETGMLPGALMTNRDLKFVSRTVHVRVESAESVFTDGYRDGQVICLPIAHHEGSYFADDNTLRTLEDKGMIAFRYVSADGMVDDDANPNGSDAGIAGLFNAERTVLGLMPHPERASAPDLGSIDGRPMFASLAAALA